jgi:hypothetical protein
LLTRGNKDGSNNYGDQFCLLHAAHLDSCL